MVPLFNSTEPPPLVVTPTIAEPAMEAGESLVLFSYYLMFILISIIV